MFTNSFTLFRLRVQLQFTHASFNRCLSFLDIRLNEPLFLRIVIHGFDSIAQASSVGRHSYVSTVVKTDL